MANYQLEVIVNDLPKLPNSLLGAKWPVRAGHAKKWHRLIWRQAWPYKPPQPLAKARLTLTRCSSVEPDYDGLVGSFKPIIDALVDIGILAGDTSKVVGQPTYRWEKAPPKKGKVRVLVEAL